MWSERFCLIAISLLIFFLPGCTSTLIPTPGPVASGALIGAATGAFVGGLTDLGLPFGFALGAVSGAVIGNAVASFPQGESPVMKPSVTNLEIVQEGEYVKILMPTDQFFIPGSPLLNPAEYKTVNDLAQLLKSYHKVSITISGYTDNKGFAAHNLALSRQRAINLADYLWAQGIDTRLIYAQGFGVKEPIATNNTELGRAQNRRIEISLHELMG